MPTAMPTAAFEIMVILIYKFESYNDEIYKLLIAPLATLEKAASATKLTELSSRSRFYHVLQNDAMTLRNSLHFFRDI